MNYSMWEKNQLVRKSVFPLRAQTKNQNLDGKLIGNTEKKSTKTDENDKTKKK